MWGETFFPALDKGEARNCPPHIAGLRHGSSTSPFAKTHLDMNRRSTMDIRCSFSWKMSVAGGGSGFHRDPHTSGDSD